MAVYWATYATDAPPPPPPNPTTCHKVGPDPTRVCAACVVDLRSVRQLWRHDWFHVLIPSRWRSVVGASQDIVKGTSCAPCKTSGDCPHLPGCDGHDCCYAGKCMCGKEECPGSKPPSGDENGHYGGKCPSGGCGGSHVQWGLSVESLTETNSSGLVVPYSMDEGRNWSQHTILMSGLKPATKYFYRVGDPV
eukprot:SAG31_NODE_1754_length_7344_cov_20.426639_2_plen_192_part_00